MIFLQAKIRKTINGLPFGRDSIVYRLDYETTTITYSPITGNLTRKTDTKKQENYTAQKTYKNIGMEQCNYLIYEYEKNR